MASKIPLHIENLSAQAATFRTAALNVSAGDRIGYAIRTTTADGIGSWSVQYSNDFVPGVDDPTLDTKWDDYPLPAPPPDSASADQKFGISLVDYEYTFVRIKFTRTAGTLTTVFVAAQMKGT